MKTIRNILKVGTTGLIVLIWNGINVWAVVPYPLDPSLIKAEKVQAEKQEIIRKIEYLKDQDIKFVTEIRNELEQMEGKDSYSLTRNETCAERH